MSFGRQLNISVVLGLRQSTPPYCGAPFSSSLSQQPFRPFVCGDLTNQHTGEEIIVVYLDKEAVMQTGARNKTYTVDEYIQHELKSEVRSEFINGQLFEMPGEKDINNQIAGNLYILFATLLRSLGYFVYAHDVKVKIFDEDKYYYPDVFITREPRTDGNTYIKSEPVLIVEVVSETSQVTDYVDKYIAYTKIPSLQYYLIVEPETTLLTCYKRGENNEWITTKYTRLEEEVKLDLADISFPLSAIYQ